jgi:hypothetical protein
MLTGIFLPLGAALTPTLRDGEGECERGLTRGEESVGQRRLDPNVWYARAHALNERLLRYIKYHWAQSDPGIAARETNSFVLSSLYCQPVCLSDVPSMQVLLAMEGC